MKHTPYGRPTNINGYRKKKSCAGALAIRNYISVLACVGLLKRKLNGNSSHSHSWTYLILQPDGKGHLQTPCSRHHSWTHNQMVKSTQGLPDYNLKQIHQ
jgi:hypothetical protein